MAATRVRVGVLGAGYISDLHLGALRRMSSVECVAVCDRSPGRAAGRAYRYGIERSYVDLAAMLERERLDVVHVLTPAETHGAVVGQILEHGVDVLVEKPMAATADVAEALATTAGRLGRVLGVSHNMLFDRNYERLRNDLRSGRFGAIDHVDVICNRLFGPLRAGPYGGWTFEDPGNILVEIGPHAAGLLLDIAGEPEDLHVVAGRPLDLPFGRRCLRRWDILGSTDAATVRLCWSFGDGFPEFLVHVRGQAGSAIVDLHRGSYSAVVPTRQQPDVDAAATLVRASAQQAATASGNLGSFVLGKLGRSDHGAAFASSIAASVDAYHRGRLAGHLDDRIDAASGVRVGRFIERIVAQVPVTAPPPTPLEEPQRRVAAQRVRPTILLVGGAGFIGRSIVRQLTGDGIAVRVLSRAARSPYVELDHPLVEVVRGDFTDGASLDGVFDGIETVAHLAFGGGSTWADVLREDVDPSMRLFDAAQAAGVGHLVFTSTIAVYWAGRRAGTITEATEPSPGIMRVNPYAHGKVVVERELAARGASGQVGTTVFRPGIVVGAGGNPIHWGVGAWPHPAACAMWGDGTAPLPFVLVDDCGAAIAVALRQRPSAPSYNLIGDVRLTGREYLDELTRASGMQVARSNARPGRYFVESLAKWGLKRVGGDRTAPRPSWYDGDGRTLRADFDCSAAKRDLHWRPVADRAQFIAEGIDAMVTGYLL